MRNVSGPSVTRGALSPEYLDRLRREVTAAVQRKTRGEEKLAGALLHLSLERDGAVDIAADAALRLGRKGAITRPLFLAAMRAVAERDHEAAGDVVEMALLGKEPTLVALSAAAFSSAKKLGPILSSFSMRAPHLAFAAELARVVRGESQGQALPLLAPKIKEAHRVALVRDVVAPLLRAPRLSPKVGAALSVLRESERHLGRQLLLSQAALRAGDDSGLRLAKARAAQGAPSTRVTWTLMAWALEGDGPPPAIRPTMEVLERLSDKPLGERDRSFLFRLADAGSEEVAPLLAAAAKSQGDAGVRATARLAKRKEPAAAQKLERIAEAPRHPQSGLAVAALLDGGEIEKADRLAKAGPRGSVTAGAWRELVASRTDDEPVATEIAARRICEGNCA